MSTKVFKLDRILQIPDKHLVDIREISDTISEVEANYFEFDLDKLPLASIEDCKQQVVKYGKACAYMGSIEVEEGIYEFDFDEEEYKEVKSDA